MPTTLGVNFGGASFSKGPETPGLWRIKAQKIAKKKSSLRNVAGNFLKFARPALTAVIAP